MTQALGLELGDIDFESLITSLINSAIDFQGAPDQIAGLKNDVEATKATVAKDEVTIESLQAQVEDLKKQLSDAEVQVAKLTKENTALAPLGIHAVQLAQAWSLPINTKTKIDAPVPSIPEVTA